jgi:hypothetical protein
MRRLAIRSDNFVDLCCDFMLQEIVEMQLLEDQQAARFVAAWLEIRMLELGTVKICEDL